MLKFLIFCTLAVAINAEITEEEDVLVLKKSNFDEALQAHPNILVEFCKWFWLPLQGLQLKLSLPLRSQLVQS